FENCRTQRNDSFEVVFQPNLSLTIENTGKTTVDWPRIVANDRGDWGTLESLVSEYTRGAKTDMEKALFLWQGTRQNRYHCIPLFADDEFHDPVKLFNSYGLNLCDDLGYGGMALFKQAGLGKPVQPIEAKVRALHGHVQGEAVVDGRYAFIDIDEGVFHLDRENERLIDGDACAHDHDLVRREVHYGPTFGAWSSSESNAALFGDDDISVFKLVQGHTMRYGLRPGEKIVFRWDNVGKYACQSEKWNRKPPYFGNSKLIYSPPLTRDRRKEGILELHNAKMLDGAVVGTAADGRVVFEFRSAWAICGGRVIAEFANGKAGLLIHPDGGKASAVWEGDGGKADVSIDKALQTHLSPAKYRYTVTAKLAKGARLNALRVETDIMTAPMSLPRLRLGENRIVYADQNKEPREITVTHRWTECDRITPPPPPDAPTYPQPDALCRDTFLDFRWPEVSDARAYHLQVSLRPDFRVPYRPSYDVIVRQNSWRVPFRGMFSSGVLYHWRLRTQSKRGIWSEWSSSWTFRWEGPRVPVNLKVEQLDDGFQLFWSANPRGERPVAYDVYGSDEKGFPVHKKAYSAYCRGKAPANFLARTTSTSMRISDPDPSHPNRNRCYYRVVAVDANGTEGISSAYVELPHPHMWSRPDTTCEVGKRWEYPVGIISSLGDAQHRRKSPTNGFWDKEIV
ncbi:MAG: hypothetical protein KAI66_20280, partial [Lentisphaeria bacterium]|nr:hypothetical protein [Lentisphaeria bacterium]